MIRCAGEGVCPLSRARGRAGEGAPGDPGPARDKLPCGRHYTRLHCWRSAARVARRAKQRHRARLWGRQTTRRPLHIRHECLPLRERSVDRRPTTDLPGSATRSARLISEQESESMRRGVQSRLPTTWLLRTKARFSRTIRLCQCTLTYWPELSDTTTISCREGLEHECHLATLYPSFVTSEPPPLVIRATPDLLCQPVSA